MKFLTVLQAQESLTGLDEAPKDICTDKNLGTQKAEYVETSQSMKRCMVTYFNSVRVGA